MVSFMELATQWMSLEALTIAMVERPARLSALLELLTVHYEQQIALAARSPAEAIWIPDNVAATIVSPRNFVRHILPVYQRVLPTQQNAGKIAVAHYDGALRALAPSLASVALPVIEAFTPPPMGDLTVQDAMQIWPDKVIWINILGTLFLESSQTIEDWTLNLLQAGAPGGRLAIGCTEDFRVEEFLKTFDAVGRAIALYEGRIWRGAEYDA